MTRIRTLRPNVTREEAVRQFSAGLSGRLRDVWSGTLRSVADFYIPFRVFEIEIDNAGKSDRRILGVDAVSGTLDPYYFESMPLIQHAHELQTRNCVPETLDHEQAEKIAITKVQRLLFTRGFFRVRNLRIAVSPNSEEIHVPYWVGFRGREGSASFEILDAVRGQPEGARLRRMLEDWLTTPANSTPNAVSPFIS